MTIVRTGGDFLKEGCRGLTEESVWITNEFFVVEIIAVGCRSVVVFTVHT